MEETPQQQGIFFDGQSARAWPVEIRLKPDVLLVRAIGDTRVHAWPLAECRFDYDPRLSPPVIRAYRNGQRLDVADAKYISILRRTESEHLRTKYFWNEIDALDAARWIGAALALMAALYFLWPHLADAVAPALPDRYLTAVGDKQMKFITGRAHKCETPDGQRVLNDLLARLAGDMAAQKGVTVSLYDGSEINAYAIPPNRIVLMDGMVQHVDSGDEIAAVLAHEIGHIEAGHAARLVMRNLGASLLGQLIGFDQSVLLLNMAHSREMEREADARGVEMMKRANISPAIMVDLFQAFEKMEKKDAQGPGLHFQFLSYLASHPVTTEREDNARKAAAGSAIERKPVLTDAEWQSLRTMCDARKVERTKGKADLGDARAEVALATHYLETKGAPPDYKEAYRLAAEAAGQQDAGGEFLLGFLTLAGRGTEPDDARAFALMLRSAQHGNAVGQLYSSAMYRYGIGTPVDGTQADLWQKNGTDQKPKLAIDKVTHIIAETEFGNAARYQLGKDLPKDTARELQYVTTAAHMDLDKAQFALGVIYIRGDIVGKNETLGFGWVAKAAAQGLPAAEGMMSTLYRDGIGTAPNPEEADKWQQQAMAHGLTAMPTPAPRAMPAAPLPGADAAQTEQATVEAATRKQEDGSFLHFTAPAPALDQPLNPRIVQVWTMIALPRTLGFSYQDGRQRLAAAQNMFTPAGWQQFQKALQDANFISSLEAGKLTSHFRLAASAHIDGQGVANGVYAWDVSAPTILSFTNEQGQSAPDVKAVLHLRIVRAPPPANLAIESWASSPQ